MKLRLLPVVLLFLFASCKFGPNGEESLLPDGTTVIDVGSSKGLTIGAYRYAEDEVGYYIAATTEGDGGRGSNLDGADVFIPDQFRGLKETASSISIGSTYQVHPKIGIFGGISFATIKQVGNFHDPSHALSPSGDYHVTFHRESVFGFEAGAHFTLVHGLTVGMRYNTSIEALLLSVGWQF